MAKLTDQFEIGFSSGEENERVMSNKTLELDAD